MLNRQANTNYRQGYEIKCPDRYDLPDNNFYRYASFVALLYVNSNVLFFYVVRSWNSASADDGLWHSQYVQFFGNSHGVKTSIPIMQAREEQDDATLGDVKGPKATSSNFGWKEEFKRSYIGMSSNGEIVITIFVIWPD